MYRNHLHIPLWNKYINKTRTWEVTYLFEGIDQDSKLTPPNKNTVIIEFLHPSKDLFMEDYDLGSLQESDQFFLALPSMLIWPNCPIIPKPWSFLAIFVALS